MMTARNLSRVTISEYLLKLRNNKYAINFRQSDPKEYVVEKLSEIKIRKPDAAAPYDLNLYHLIAILDYFNTDINYCEYCHLPYSYKILDHGNESGSVCIFCYILSQDLSPLIYATMDNDKVYLGYEDRKVSVSSQLFEDELEDDKALLEFIRQEHVSSTAETALDEYF